MYDGNKGICIEENGTYKLQAICYNEKGIASDIATETYRLSLAAPDYPKVTPDGGWADDTTLVTIETESYCSVYYTWDNTRPDNRIGKIRVAAGDSERQECSLRSCRGQSDRA